MKMFPLPAVGRIEVIDETGRVYVNIDCDVELDLQDNCRTLKVFVKKKALEYDFVGRNK